MANIVKKDDNLLPALIKEVEDKIVVIRNLEVIADAIMTRTCPLCLLKQILRYE